MTLLFAGAAAAAPGLINFQGRLTGAAGHPVTQPTAVTFTFWNAQSDGQQLGNGFSDTDTVTPDAQGTYTTMIGDAPGNPVPDAVFAGEAVWLNINIAGTNLTPRWQITTVGYAFRSNRATAADTATTAGYALQAGRSATAAAADTATTAAYAVNAKTAGQATNAANAAHATGADTAAQADRATAADTATHANTATTATIAIDALHAQTADTATTASYALQADRATTATTAAHADHATNADTATTATYAAQAQTATQAAAATSASSAAHADHASAADAADLAVHAKTADTATTASYALQAGRAASAAAADTATTATHADLLGGMRAAAFATTASLAAYTPRHSGAIYRWAVFNTYDYATTWFTGNSNPSLYGGVYPSTWGDSGAIAANISADKEVLRTLFTHKGYGGQNALVWSEEWISYAATNSKHALALFRIRNTTANPIVWTVRAYQTAYGGWGECASVAVNGVNAWASGGASIGPHQMLTHTLPFPPSRVSTVIFVASSGPALQVASNIFTRA